jgi:hypothetical protein
MVGLVKRLRLEALGSMDPHLTATTAIKEWSWTSLNTVGASQGHWVGSAAPINWWPTLNRHNLHQGVILDVPQHGRCITRPLSRVGRTYQLVGRAKPTQGADLQPPQEQWSGSSKFICGGSQSRPHLEIRSHLLAQHCSSLSPTSTPSCSHQPIGSIYREWHLVEGHKWLESKWRSPT